jgi:probable F420-dependent oxidoreductase
MRMGIGLPAREGTDLSRHVTRMAAEAEKAGAASLWVYERVIWPVEPTTGMYGVPGLPWTPAYSQAADALTLLTAAATVTDKARLGTGVLIAPLHAPLHMARTLATLDGLSGGRVIAGLGTGWSPDEYRAMGADFNSRGRALDESIDACRALWADGPTTYRGSRIDIDNAFVRPKPVARIPIMLGGGSTPNTIRRIAEKSDGWLPSNSPRTTMSETWRQIRDLAHRAGRDAQALQLIPRGNIVLTETPLGPDRAPFNGSWDQIVDDAADCSAEGADELVLDLFMSCRDGDEQIDLSLEALDRMRTAGVAE